MLKALCLAVCLEAVLAPSAIALDCNGKSLSQTDMNECSRDDFRKADALLNKRYQQILGCLKDKARSLVEAQRAWIKFRDAECAFQGSASEGGSVQPMAISLCRKSVTEERAKGLDYYLTCEEGDVSCPTVACGFRKDRPAK